MWITRAAAKRANIKVGKGPAVRIGIGTVASITNGTVTLQLHLSKSTARKLAHLRHVDDDGPPLARRRRQPQPRDRRRRPVLGTGRSGAPGSRARPAFGGARAGEDPELALAAAEHPARRA